MSSGPRRERARVLVTRALLEPAAGRLAASVDVVGPLEPEERSRLADHVVGCQGIVCQLTDPVPRSVLEASPELAVVSNVAVGHDNIDLTAAHALGIAVTNTPGVLTESTADFAWALLLAAARHVVPADRYLRDGRWGEWQLDLWCGVELRGKTLGILGCGRIGQAVARRARGFGLRCIYHNRTRLPVALEDELGLERVEFAGLLERSDFLSIHCPLTEDSRHLIDDAALRQLRATAIVINTARGPIVDELALADALEQGRLGGAGLDVFEREPEVPARLVALDRVVLAPHLGSATWETRRAMCELAVDGCLAVLRGERPTNIVSRPDPSGTSP